MTSTSFKHFTQAYASSKTSIGSPIWPTISPFSTRIFNITKSESHDPMSKPMDISPHFYPFWKTQPILSSLISPISNDPSMMDGSISLFNLLSSIPIPSILVDSIKTPLLHSVVFLLPLVFFVLYGWILSSESIQNVLSVESLEPFNASIKWNCIQTSSYHPNHFHHLSKKLPCLVIN